MSRGRQRKGSGKRRRAREMAVQMLYQQELGGSDLERVFATFDLEDYVGEVEEKADHAQAARRRAEESFEHARVLVRGTLTHGDDIDDRIRAHAENWRLERMPAIDRNILRLAVYEMLHGEGVPQVVILDEAIELAKKFGTESSGRFVNGLLDGVLKASRPAAGGKAAETRRNGGGGEPRKGSES